MGVGGAAAEKQLAAEAVPPRTGVPQLAMKRGREREGGREGGREVDWPRKSSSL